MSDGHRLDPYRDFSEFYDLYVGDWIEDLPLYIKYAAAARTPVLEVGAGSGRLTIPLARSGASVVAADVSPSMLSLLEARLAEQPAGVRRKIRVVEADARELDLGSQHDLVVVPFYTFNYLLSPEDRRAALARFRSHLSTDGRLLMDVFAPLGRLARPPLGPVQRVDTVDPSTGSRIRGWNSYQIDPERQIERREHLFEVTARTGAVRRRVFTVERSYTLPEQMESLLASCGLAIEDVTTGYAGERPGAESEQLLYVLRATG